MKRALLLLLFSTSALAADPLAAGAEALKNGDYAKALAIDEEVIRDMVGRVGPIDPESKRFPAAVAQKALALAGLGRNDEAIWYWHVAQSLEPATDVAPTEFLKQHPFMEPSLKFTATIPPPPLPANVTAPKPVKRVEPRYPGPVKAARVGGLIIAALVVDRNGAVRDIEIRKASPAPTLVYETTEALHQWTFTPATVDGKPVEALYTQVVSYRLP